MDKQTILFIGVGQDQLPAIKKAVELNLRVIGFDGNKDAPGFEFCDMHECCDIKNIEAIRDLALEYNKRVGVDGVMAPAVDAGASVGIVVDTIGLLGIGYQKANELTDKVLRRKLLEYHNIWQPEWGVKACLWNTYPCVIKPRNKAGAEGVKLIKKEADLKFEKFDIIEEYLEGWEISTEVLVFNNQSTLLVNADRNYDKKNKWPPYLIEDGCQLPSKIPLRISNKISMLVNKLVQVLNLRNCAIKLDLLVKDNIVYVLECAPRMGGGKLSSEMINMAFGIDWWKLAIKVAMGMPITQEEIIAKHIKCVAQRYKFPDKVTSHRDRLYSVECEGDDYEKAIQNAEKEIENTRMMSKVAKDMPR